MDDMGAVLASFNDLYLVGATAIGALYMGLRGIFAKLLIGLLGGLGRGAGTGIGNRMTGGTGGGSSGGGGANLSTANKIKHAKQALYAAAGRKRRIQIYLETWVTLLTVRDGSHALSIFLHSLIHPSFNKKVSRLRNRCRKFDELEGRVQHILGRYERDFERHCLPLRNELIALDVNLARWKARHRRWFGKIWRKRWWYYKRNIRKTRWKMIKLQIRLYKKNNWLNIAYRPELEPALVELHHYERIYLTSWVHSFEADLESFRLTVISGRLIEQLQKEQYADHKDYLGLSELPEDMDETRKYLREFLKKHGVGIGPESSVEGLFEAFLRLRLIHDPEMRKRWGVDYVWLTQSLPPPGALGLADAKYNHLESNRHWYPGIETGIPAGGQASKRELAES